MDIRQWDPSPATGYRHRPKPRLAGAAAASAGEVKPGLARSPRMAVLGVRAAPPGGPRPPVTAPPPGGFAPPAVAPTASRAPSHATSAAS
jgi:hypothetical protein